jgi:hypothetical protein
MNGYEFISSGRRHPRILTIPFKLAPSPSLSFLLLLYLFQCARQAKRLRVYFYHDSGFYCFLLLLLDHSNFYATPKYKKIASLYNATRNAIVHYASSNNNLPVLDCVTPAKLYCDKVGVYKLIKNKLAARGLMQFLILTSMTTDYLSRSLSRRWFYISENFSIVSGLRGENSVCVFFVATARE